jgi:hypothetical protein
MKTIQTFWNKIFGPKETTTIVLVDTAGETGVYDMHDYKNSMGMVPKATMGVVYIDNWYPIIIFQDGTTNSPWYPEWRAHDLEAPLK